MPHVRRLLEGEVLDARVPGLLHPSAGAVEEEQQYPIPKGEPAKLGQTLEERLDLLTRDEARLRERLRAWWG